MSREPGMRADLNTTCHKCGGVIRIGDRVVPTRAGRWIHPSCAPGGDDE